MSNEIVRSLMMVKETYSFVAEESVIRRVEDKRRLLELLLGNMEVEDRVCVIPIFCMGGLGKSIVAQPVFNHENVKKKFHERIWVCVFENFEVKAIARIILGQHRLKRG